MEPIGQNECGSCPYEQWCAQQMGPDDPSAAITIGRLEHPRVADSSANGRDHNCGPIGFWIPTIRSFFDEYFAEVGHLTPDTPASVSRQPSSVPK